MAFRSTSHLHFPRHTTARRARAVLAAVLLFPSVLASQAWSAVPVSAAPAAGVVPAPPAGKAYFGSYSPPLDDWSQASQKNEILQLESKLGRTLDVTQYFYDWGDSFPTWRESWALSSGRIPMMSWAGYNTDTINTGSQDALIRARADGVKALGRPVFIRWLWEMDGTWTEKWVKSPSSFIAAWRRIYGIFRSRGATNAAFVWCPNAWGWMNGEAPQYYPGNAYVDWICSDGYNWNPGKPNTVWREFSWIFKPFYDWSVARGKPIMVGEYGCQERASGEKGKWITNARNALKTQFPAIKAVLYFDEDRVYDWRVDTSTSSMNAFKGMAQDPYFNP